jgi:hypothetical protein
MKFEYKYIVPVSQMDDLRRAIRPYVEMDPFAARFPSNEYTVRSIYFDTFRFDYFFEKLDGFKLRKKIRIRGYNDQIGDDIVFLEVKRKVKEPIEKAREKLSFDMVKKLLNGSTAKCEGGDLQQHQSDSNRAGSFLFHIYSQNLKPVVLVIYEREAYFNRFTRDVRLTIDKNLRSVPYPLIDDLFNGEKARPALKDQFIFEVKFREFFPGWLRPITGRLGLFKQSASKYVMCVDSHNLTDTSRKSEVYRMMHWKSVY